MDGAPLATQVAELSAGSDPGGVHLSRKARKELLVALQDAAAMDSGERAAIEQISSRLRRAWCEAPPPRWAGNDA